MSKTVIVSDDIYNILREFANQKTAPENDATSGEEFSIFDWYGSNVDDAYDGGIKDGCIELARMVLKDSK